MMKAYRLAAAAILCALCALKGAADPPASEAVLFNRDIRPILSDTCFKCHGPDRNARKAGLRLDLRAEALKRAVSGKIPIVPGKPEASALVQRVFASNPAAAMPPPEAHKPLTPRQKALLRRWVAQGALYQRHWAYEPPVKAAVPAGANGIDFLVRKRLATLGLAPSPPADRRTLIRRLHFDLLGLPPTPQEVTAFVQDRSPGAYEKLVARLLASPHYGERMAQGWLDVVRFADTIGYHSDTPRNIYPYRDYVIQAFNSNKPFDRFTREQIAGDLLPDASQETRVGSAFNRLLLTTEEGGAQPKDYEARYLTDRVRAVGTVWLGQTTGCAQCHDHKFDPLTTRDFYRLGAFFADIEEGIVGAREPGMLVPDAGQAAELARRDARRTELQRRYDAPHPELAAAQAAWEKEVRDASALWTPLKPATATALGGATLTIQPDNAILARGANPEKTAYTIDLAAPRTLAGLRVEALPDPTLPAHGPGRAGNGNFVLTEALVQVVKTGAAPRPLRFAAAQASFEQTIARGDNPYPLWSAASAIDGDAQGAGAGWAILPEVGKPQALVLTLAEPVTLSDGEILQVTLRQDHGSGHTLGKFRLAATGSADALRAPPLPAPDEVAALAQIAPDRRTAPQAETIHAYFKSVAPALSELRQQLAEAKQARSDYEASLPRCLVTVKNAAPRTVRVLPRGNFLDESGEAVTPATPSFLPPPRTRGREPNRLDLADWLVSRENPLTARAVMNRLWRQFFGTGLSKVLDDLGAQGEPPANPALLDWLAVEFMDHGWDIQRMVRLLVTSATYRQTSMASKALRTRDPDNREYARQSRFRLDAEFVRDNALAVSGLLSRKIGGPSVKPYQPERYWENLNFPVREYTPDKGESQYRRGLYIWWQRSFLHPSLLAFDAPSREECTAERSRSNIPQQALALLNDPTYVEAARAFGARILTEASGTPEQRLVWAWRQALQRDPSPAERMTLHRLYVQQRAAYRADRSAAEALLQTGDAPAPGALDRAEIAAWTHVARVLLNLHETITRP